MTAEQRAWERFRAAILRCQADPTDENLAQMRRCRDECVAALEATSSRPSPRAA